MVGALDNTILPVGSSEVTFAFAGLVTDDVLIIRLLRHTPVQYPSHEVKDVTACKQTPVLTVC